ncbi:MAG: TIM44-like domain-containing protein [Acidimicrobiales bacterium]
MHYGGGGSLGLLVLIIFLVFAFRTMGRMGRGRWRGGPWRGGPWQGGPWPGGPAGGPPRGGGRQQQSPPPWPGAGQGGGPPPGGGGMGRPKGGGGPAGGGWAGGGWTGSGAGIPAASGRGARERLAGAGVAWPPEDSRAWMNDPRPAAASIPGELFPEQHVRSLRAASPLDAGLAAIMAHDPGFELEQFTQQAQRVFFLVEQGWSERKPEMTRRVMADPLWQTHRVQIQAYLDSHKSNRLDYLAVSDIWPVAAHSDAGFDTITVRIVAACTDYDVDDRTGRVVRGDKEVARWEEDWTFQRSSAAQTRPGGSTLGSSCPNCGAPLDVDPAGSCRYCKASIMSGDYDWVLATISEIG